MINRRIYWQCLCPCSGLPPNYARRLKTDHLTTKVISTVELSGGLGLALYPSRVRSNEVLGSTTATLPQ